MIDFTKWKVRIQRHHDRNLSSAPPTATTKSRRKKTDD